MHRPLRKTLLLAALFFTVGSVHAHRKSMLSRGYPPPPPTVDPGPDAATLRITVKDARTGRPVSATISVNGGDQEPEVDPYQEFSLRRSANRHKGPIRFRPLDYYFFTDGTFEIKVPPGKSRITLRKGYEYAPVEEVFQLVKKEIVERTLFLTRWIDMAEEGWYSGDMHLHFDRTGQNDEVLLTLTSARDIKFGFILSMNTRGYDRGREFESWSQVPGLGERYSYRKGLYTLISGQEYRAQWLGHVTIVLAEGYVAAKGRSENVDAGPSLGLISDQAHQLGGYIGLNHGGYDHMEADALGLEGQTDFLELLQFGGYRGLGLDGWYDFLNIGYRWPIVAGSDFPYTRELGDCLTYAFVGEKATPRKFVEQVSKGASFVTSGPMLFLDVNGKRPGGFVTLDGRDDPRVEVNVRVRSPLYPVRHVEVISNGRTVSRRFSPDGRASWAFEESLPIGAAGWIAARAYGDAGIEAHTNPVYVFLKGKRPFDPDACDQILARLAGSLRSIDNPRVKKRLRDLKGKLEEYRNTGSAGSLKLPPLPLNWE